MIEGVVPQRGDEARGEKMRGDVLFELGESQGGPSIEKIVW